MSQQMLACIRSSINDDCALKVKNSGREPAVTIKKGTREKTIEDGPMFLKIMISHITIKGYPDNQNSNNPLLQRSAILPVVTSTLESAKQKPEWHILQSQSQIHRARMAKFKPPPKNKNRCQQQLWDY